jgi:peptidoglycan/xylan/chitin deacetylase (PgdA/CDA1 family)
MRRLAKSAFCVLYKYSGALAAQETVSRWAGRAFIPILLFHRVTDEIPEDGLTVSTGWFRECCKMLSRRFRTVGLGEVHRLVQAGETPPRRTVAITFDDCYRDNLGAARTLAEFGLPATFFVPTKFVGTDHVFPWDNTLKRMPNLSWDDVAEMVRLGHDFGSHTVSHADLGQIDDQAARMELQESKRMLEEQLARPVRWFAYPFGGRHNFRPERLPLVYDAGYDACFSGYGGVVTRAMQGQVLPREPVPYFRNVLNLELHLTGCLDWLYAIKRQVGLVCV